ncbi:MAG: hypothetical protein GX793_07590 [Bacteroidales bacterium]|jgi:hypothetical protein|nr:hypothetical protein [Bacteroidales bacterium]MCK9499100.1 hypothetical protein [Bacteroidales bacterium]MDY0314345.1 hypothetical protein [Bacteroidales bacterium]NLB86905.1 hypothetical protein [Bacteroidales bacterium]
MKTKKIIILIAFILGFSFCYAQETNQKLLVKFDANELKEMKKTNSDNFDFLEYYVSEALYFVPLPNKHVDYKELIRINPKTKEVSENQIITEADLDNFNPLEYDISYELDKYTYYLAGNTGMLLVVPSQRDLKLGSDNRIKLQKLNKKQ